MKSMVSFGTKYHIKNAMWTLTSTKSVMYNLQFKRFAVYLCSVSPFTRPVEAVEDISTWRQIKVHLCVTILYGLNSTMICSSFVSLSMYILFLCHRRLNMYFSTIVYIESMTRNRSSSSSISLTPFADEPYVSM